MRPCCHRACHSLPIDCCGTIQTNQERDAVVASIRLTLKNEARRLAAAADEAETADCGYHVPNFAILRLHRMLQNSDRPVEVLRWAWRSQLATYVDSGSHLDGLASMYLHAALLDLRRGGDPRAAQPGSTPAS
jgi:hypothetical protein